MIYTRIQVNGSGPGRTYIFASIMQAAVAWVGHGLPVYVSVFVYVDIWYTIYINVYTYIQIHIYNQLRRRHLGEQLMDCRWDRANQVSKQGLYIGVCIRVRLNKNMHTYPDRGACLSVFRGMIKCVYLNICMIRHLCAIFRWARDRKAKARGRGQGKTAGLGGKDSGVSPRPPPLLNPTLLQGR